MLDAALGCCVHVPFKGIDVAAAITMHQKMLRCAAPCNHIEYRVGVANIQQTIKHQTILAGNLKKKINNF